MKYLLSALALLSGTAGALDLTPQEDFKELEGFKMPMIRFADGARKVLWRPPPDWRMSYEDGRILLLSKAYTHASLELRVVRRVAGDVDLLSRPDALARYIGNMLPKTAKGTSLTGTTEGVFTINGIAAKEFQFEFQEPSHPSRGSVGIVDLNDRERLILLITAQPRDFDEVREAGVQSMFSWQEE
jgi:hypothetical protein